MADSLADDEAKLRQYATDLTDALDAALPEWIRRCVTDRVPAETPDADLDAAIASAVEQAQATTVPQVRALLAQDIAEQRANPLALLRAAVSYPTAALQSLGAPPLDRPAFESERFPDDIYDLSPAAFGDIDPSLHEPGLTWGAAKAHVHLRRRREQAPPGEPASQAAASQAAIAAFAPDLMDQSKLKGAFGDLTMLRSPAALAGTDATVVLVDVGRPGVLDVIGSISGRVIGFGSHVDDELLAAADAAGCDVVLARSVFFGRVAKGTLLDD